MLINAPCVVSLTWRLADTQGQAIDELNEPVEFFFGGDDLLPKVEEALAGQAEGYEVHLHLEPEHAFGDYDADLVCFEDRALFPDEVEPGMQFEGLPEGATTPDMPGDAMLGLKMAIKLADLSYLSKGDRYVQVWRTWRSGTESRS